MASVALCWDLQGRSLQAQTVELGAQSVRIEPGGLADGGEIPLILEEIFFGLAFGSQRPRNPFLNCRHDHCLPQSHFEA